MDNINLRHLLQEYIIPIPSIPTLPCGAPPPQSTQREEDKDQLDTQPRARITENPKSQEDSERKENDMVIGNRRFQREEPLRRSVPLLLICPSASADHGWMYRSRKIKSLKFLVAGCPPETVLSTVGVGPSAIGNLDAAIQDVEIEKDSSASAKEVGKVCGEEDSPVEPSENIESTTRQEVQGPESAAFPVNISEVAGPSSEEPSRACTKLVPPRSKRNGNVDGKDSLAPKGTPINVDLQSAGPSGKCTKPILQQTKRKRMSEVNSTKRKRLTNPQLTEIKMSTLLSNYIKKIWGSYGVTKDVLDSLVVLGSKDTDSTSSQADLEYAMEETFKLRYDELFEKNMSIKEAATLFPLLKVFDYLSVEFASIYSRDPQPKLDMVLDTFLEQKKAEMDPGFERFRSVLADFPPAWKLVLAAQAFGYEKTNKAIEGTLFRFREPGGMLVNIPRNTLFIDVVKNENKELWDIDYPMDVYVEYELHFRARNFYEALIGSYYIYWIFNLDYTSPDDQLFIDFDNALNLS